MLIGYQIILELEKVPRTDDFEQNYSVMTDLSNFIT